MIHELRVGGFKGFGRTRAVPLAPITLVYGPNSSGKSALLQAMSLLSQSLPESAAEVKPSQPLTFRGPQADLGDFQNAVYRHSRSQSIKLGLTHDFRTRDQSETLRPGWAHLVPPESPRATFDATVRSRREGDFLAGLDWGTEGVDGRRARFRRTGPSGEVTPGCVYVLGGPALRSLVTELLQRLARQTDPQRGRRRKAEPFALPSSKEAYDAIRRTPISLFGFLPEQIHAGSSGLASISSGESPWRRLDTEAGFAGLGGFTLAREIEALMRAQLLATRDALASLRSLGPLREAPRRIELSSMPSSDFVGARGEQTSSILYRDTDLRSRVNEWLRRLEIPYDVRVERLTPRGLATVGEILTLQLNDRRTEVAVSSQDVGFGISQVLPVVTQLLTEGAATVLIEQPEIHLHPRLQANLGDLFLEAASSGTQVIAETHSESLLLRMQRRIREGSADPAQIKVVYVGVADGVGSYTMEIPLDQSGEFTEEWPGGFFEERLDELF